MPENSKKSTRGAQGSVEDDVNEAKRQVKISENMADTDDREKSEVEPNLSDGGITVFCKQYPKW